MGMEKDRDTWVLSVSVKFYPYWAYNIQYITFLKSKDFFASQWEMLPFISKEFMFSPEVI